MLLYRFDQDITDRWFFNRSVDDLLIVQFLKQYDVLEGNFLWVLSRGLFQGVTTPRFPSFLKRERGMVVVTICHVTERSYVFVVWSLLATRVHVG